MLERYSGAIFRLSAAFALILVGLSIVLIAFRIEQVLLEFAQSRSLRAAHQVREQIEGGFRLGLTLSDQSNLGDWLQRQRTQDSALTGARVQTDNGDIVARLGADAAFNQLNPAWTAQLLVPGTGAAKSANSIARRAGSMAYIGVPVADPAARRVAVVWLAFDRTALEKSAWSILIALWPYAALAVIALTSVLTLLARLWLQGARNRLVSVAQVFTGNDVTEPLTSVPYKKMLLADKALDEFRVSTGLLERKPVVPILVSTWVLIVLLALAWQAREVARPLLITQIDQNARTVLASAQGHIERALRFGVPADQLVGVEAMFASELQPAAEIAFLALRQSDGQIVAFSPGTNSNSERNQHALDWLAQSIASTEFRTAAEQIARVSGQQDSGELLVGTPLNYVDERIRSMLVDLMVAMVVSWVLMRELLGAMWRRSLFKTYVAFESAWKGWRLRAQQLVVQSGAKAHSAALAWLAEVQTSIDGLLRKSSTVRLVPALDSSTTTALVRIRLIVFLTALSEELLRPFFAIFASEINPLSISLAVSPTLLAGLPVAAFMLTLALAQPLGPWITRHVETRRALCIGALLGMVLMGLTAFSQSALVLIGLRAGSGVVYGLMLILSQTAIVYLSSTSQRARSLVEVSAAIVAAGVCGPALGGLLAERLGASATFMACASCLAIAAIASLGLPKLASHGLSVAAGLGGWRGMAAVLSHPKVLAVIWLAAVPARLAAAALLVVVTPLYLLEIGETTTVTGRVLLLYFLAFMLTAPLIAHRSDVGRQRWPWIIAGCGLSAIACAALPLVGGVLGAALCCALLGIAQAMLSAPMIALVTETFDIPGINKPFLSATATPAQALAAFRFVERFGSIAAPFVVALAVFFFGLTGAAGALGVLLALGGVGIALVSARFSNHKESLDAAH